MIIKVKPYRYRVTQTNPNQEDIVTKFLSAKEVSEYLKMPLPTVASNVKMSVPCLTIRPCSIKPTSEEV